MTQKLKLLARYYSTWVVALFAALAVAWPQVPQEVKDGLFSVFPSLRAYDSFVWLLAFVLSFARARTTPQGIEQPKP